MTTKTGIPIVLGTPSPGRLASTKSKRNNNPKAETPVIAENLFQLFSDTFSPHHVSKFHTHL